jgi:hypothetical protein
VKACVAVLFIDFAVWLKQPMMSRHEMDDIASNISPHLILPPTPQPHDAGSESHVPAAVQNLRTYKAVRKELGENAFAPRDVGV